MFVPNTIVKSLKHQHENLKEEFGILCWNVAKLTLHSSYKTYIETLLQKYDLDILLLQEVKKNLSDELCLHDYSYILSPNIQTKRHIFGVLSAFKSSCEEEMSLLSKKREFRYATHKTSLITHHKFSNGKKILIVNLHAINFVKNSDFKNELDSLLECIKSHSGAMIVAGDFNTWNRTRVEYLKKFAEHLGLKRAESEDEANLKKVFSNSLDYILYRELDLIYAKAIDSKKISDHNPIIAKFKQ